MNYFNNICLGVLAIVLISSCADESLLDYDVKKPEQIQNYDYLKEYDVLKEYVSRESHPDFILGAGVSLPDFNKKGYQYAHIVSNFNEITAGYNMKHGAIVTNNGDLQLAGVVQFVETAEQAGITIYGHTLCWHSNQNATYLNNIIAPTIIPPSGGVKWSPIADQNFETDEAPNYEGSSDAIVSLTTDGEGANGEGRAIKVTNTVVQSDDWKTQFFVVFDEPMELGETYRLTMDVKADMEVSCSTQAHITPGNYKHWSFFGSISATTSWTTFTKEIVISEDNEGAGALAINLGLYASSYYFDNITIAKYNSNAGPSWNIVSGADFETEDASNYQIDLTSSISFSNDGEGAEGKGRALIVRNPTVRDNDWESQFFLSFSPATEVGEKYILSMDVKADEDVSYSTQAHITPGNYKYWNFFGSINATTEWSNFTKEITISDEVSGVGAIAFNLGNMATNYYFDNIQLTKLSEGSSVEQIIEKTPEEKRDTVSYALEKWISEMMLATKKYVKAWDVVNEPMDDGNPYELKSGIGKEVDSDHFYWQDYLGKDYAVMAFNLARQYGNTDDVLFINDYNLAYNIDKCKGLIAYVDYIEQQGVFIDGIGTQMHINVNSDRDKIIQMFELLAETGKLIKVSELDVGLGDHKQTSLATEADYMSQADMYQFVVEKYFELIPANQRYGITVWSPIDSPAESSWRAGEPIGLWTEGYSRKHAYAGFADGLSESN